MKVYVFDAQRFDGKTKKDKEMHGVFVRGMGLSNMGYKCVDKFVDDKLLEGQEIKNGSVANLYFDDNGYVEEIRVLPNVHFEIVTDE